MFSFLFRRDDSTMFALSVMDIAHDMFLNSRSSDVINGLARVYKTNPKERIKFRLEL